MNYIKEAKIGIEEVISKSNFPKNKIKKVLDILYYIKRKELEKKAEETLIDAINGKWEYQPEKKNISDLWQDFRCDLKYLLMPRNIKNEAERLLPEYTKYASIILNELPKKGK